MRALQILLLIGSLAVLTCCSKDETGNDDVDTFIAMVKAGEYGSIYLPEFTPVDIPALLTYTDDKSIISRFPSILCRHLPVLTVNTGLEYLYYGQLNQ